MLRFKPHAEKMATALHEMSPTPFFAQVTGGCAKISLDASRRSIVDSFSAKFRDAFLEHLMRSIPAKTEITAAFTESETLDGHRPIPVRERHMVLWQDKEYSTDDLYLVADQVQMLLSNLGFTRYPANVLRPVATRIVEQSQKTSITDRLKIAVSSKLGLSFDRSQSQTRETFESLAGCEPVRKESTQKDDPDKGKWDFALPYLKEIGQAMDLMTPEALVKISGQDSVERQLVDNILDETYQRLRVSEVELCNATAKALPDWMKQDKKLLWLLNHAYIVEAMGIMKDAAEGIPGYRNPDQMRPLDKKMLADTQWALHMALYAGLYRGARQHIEDHLVAFVVENLKPVAQSRQWISVAAEVERDYSCYPMVSAVPLQEIPEAAPVFGYVQRIGVPIRVFVDDAKAVTVTAWPELTDTGRNHDTGGSAYAKVRYPPLSDGEPVLVPTDAIAFRRAKEAVMRYLQDSEDRKVLTSSETDRPDEIEMVLRRDEAEDSHDYRNGSSSGFDSMDIPG